MLLSLCNKLPPILKTNCPHNKCTTVTVDSVYMCVCMCACDFSCTISAGFLDNYTLECSNAVAALQKAFKKDYYTLT